MRSACPASSRSLPSACGAPSKAWRSFPAETRQRTYVMWDAIVFFLNSLIFTLIGLQLPPIVQQLTAFSWPLLFGYAAAISLATIVARVCGSFPRRTFRAPSVRRLRKRDPPPPWRNVGPGLLCRPARYRVAGGGHGAAARPSGRQPVARARPDRVPDVRRHRDDARRAGIEPALRAPPSRIRRRHGAGRDRRRAPGAREDGACRPRRGRSAERARKAAGTRGRAGARRVCPAPWPSRR